MSVATVSAPPGAGNMDITCINTIRTLSVNAVQAANSGHPGTPMAMARLWLTASGRSLFVSIRKTGMSES